MHVRSFRAPSFDVVFEGLELLIPLGLELVEPGLQCDHRVGPKPEETDTSIFGRAFVVDHSGAKQYPQMPAHGRGGQPRRLGQVSGSARTGAKQLHDVTPSGIGQGLEEGRDGDIAICDHASNI